MIISGVLVMMGLLMAVGFMFSLSAHAEILFQSEEQTWIQNNPGKVRTLQEAGLLLNVLLEKDPDLRRSLVEHRRGMNK